jgi:DNA-binding PadR family transcriptional regulator
MLAMAEPTPGAPGRSAIPDPTPPVGFPDMVRLTTTVVQALAFMLRKGGECYGREIIQSTGMAPGTLYPILNRLEAAGVTEGHDETIDRAGFDGRAPRRYYRFTPAGADFARKALTRLGVGS